MHYKVFSEVMTTMFHQCGILMDCNIFEMQNYELFLKALHHHLVIGHANLTTDYNGIFNPRVQNFSNDFSLTSRDVAHIMNKKNDQAKQNQK